jgi:hypothetical protein
VSAVVLKDERFKRVRAFDADPEVYLNGMLLHEGIDYSWLEGDRLQIGPLPVIESDFLALQPKNLITKKYIAEESISLVVMEVEERDLLTPEVG